MICYRDRSFCNFYKTCKYGNSCSRAMTDEVIEKAKKWSESFGSEDILICQYAEKPDCFEDM